MGKQKPENLYDGLDPYQLDQLKADLERWQQIGKLKPPAAPAAAPPTFGDRVSSVGDTLRKGFWRGMENLSRYGEGAAWMPIQALKLPGSIDEAVTTPQRTLSDVVTGTQPTYKPGFWGKVKQGATNVEKELHQGTQFFQEKAGVPKEEAWYPTTQRIIPSWIPEVAGSFTAPAPMLSPIKKLLSKEAIKPALKGAAQMGGYSGTVAGVGEFNKPEDQRDWSNVPTAAAAGAVMSPFIQRLLGSKAARPAAAPAPLTGIPHTPRSVTAPPPRPPQAPPPPEPTPPVRQIPDYVDAEFHDITTDGTFPPYAPTKELDYNPAQGPTIYAHGPVATGPGTAIQLPGEVFGELPPYPGIGPPTIDAYWSHVSPEDVGHVGTVDPRSYGGPVAEQGSPNVPAVKPYSIQQRTPQEPAFPDSLAVNQSPRDPFLTKSPTAAAAVQQAPVMDDLDAMAGEVRPSLVKPHDLLPDQLEVNAGQQDPFLVKRSTDQLDTFMDTKLQPGTTTLPNPDTMPTKQIASTPRHELPVALNRDMENRASFARDTMGMQGTERGFNTMGDAGSSKSPTFQWYKEVTIDGGLKPADVESALAKIEQDHGADKGKNVARVKEALLKDPEFVNWQRSYGTKDPLLEAQAEWNVVPEEPLHPADFPQDVLPPLEDTWPNPTQPLRASGGGSDLSGTPFNNHPLPDPGELFHVPPETIGSRPIIGREVSQFDDAPLFHPSSQVPDVEQTSLLGHTETPKIGDTEIFSGDVVPVREHGGPAVLETPAGHEAMSEVKQEVEQDAGFLDNLGDLLNNERGSTHLGGGVGPIERVLTQRRFAEKHPTDFGPVYRSATDRFEWQAAQKHDLTQLGRSYFLLDPTDRKVVDQFLRDRRRGKAATIPPALRPAVNAVDNMMQSSYDLINAVRAAKGLLPIAQDPNYVPFSRSGDYLTIATAPNGSKWVSAATTLREAETRARAVEEQLKQQFPGSTPDVLVKTTSNKKGDLPSLDFGTMALLEKAGLLSPADYDKAVEQFDLPPGFGAHFKNAQKVLGESKDLLDPITRYIDGVTNYTARFLHDDEMKNLIDTIKDPAVRQYAEKYRDYLNTKPQEYSRLRGGVAVWDLALNAGSIFQNATQVPLLGFPNLQRELGIKGAAKAFTEGYAALLHPSVEYQNVLNMAEREGHIKPVNAEELFGARGGPAGQELQFGSPYVQRQIEKGWLPKPIGGAIRGALDATAGGVESLISKGADASLAIGQKLSYAMHRLTGSSAPVAADKALSAHPVLMQGFAGLEEFNRKVSILHGYIAGKMKGLSPAEAYEFAKVHSRNTNFDYSPASRAELFRGGGAPLGLFMTFQTEYMAQLSKMVREQLKQPGLKKLGGAATTALAGFWTLAGMKGIPGLDDLDLYGPNPGMMSQNLPDWAWHGPVSAASGFDVAAKFKLGPRVPYDMLHGSVDLSQIPVAQPFANAFQATDWFLQQPHDGPNTQKYIERLLPPAARSLAQSGRWAGMGPAGGIEDGEVGTIKGHTPGPTENGKREFFHPDAIDTLGKAVTFTPLELSKQYTRGRIQQQLKDRQREDTTKLTNTAAHNLDLNGPGVQSPALIRLQKEHPNTYKELLRAHARKRSGQEKGSTEQIYRKMQEPKVIK